MIDYTYGQLVTSLAREHAVTRKPFNFAALLAVTASALLVTACSSPVDDLSRVLAQLADELAT